MLLFTSKIVLLHLQIILIVQFSRFCVIYDSSGILIKLSWPLLLTQHRRFNRIIQAIVPIGRTAHVLQFLIGGILTYFHHKHLPFGGNGTRCIGKCFAVINGVIVSDVLYSIL